MNTCKARLHAVSEAIEACSSDAARQQVSATQSEAFVSAISSFRGTAKQAAELSCLVLNVPWATRQDLQVALVAVQKSARTQTDTFQGTQTDTFQDYTAMDSYGNQEFWASVVGAPNAVYLVATLALSLGMRNGSQPSVQKLVILSILATYGFECAIQFSNMQFEYVAKQMKVALSRCTTEVSEAIETLLASPVHFQQHHPATYAQVYSTGGPVSCPFSQVHITQLVNVVPMRMSALRRHEAVPMHSQRSMCRPTQPMHRPMQPQSVMDGMWPPAQAMEQHGGNHIDYMEDGSQITIFAQPPQINRLERCSSWYQFPIRVFNILFFN